MQRNYAKKLLAGLSTLFVVMIVGPFCDNPVKPPPPPPGPLELLEPLGGSGKSVKVGDTVTVKWSIHDPNKITSIGISYSLDGGTTVTNRQLLADYSIAPPDTTYRWVVDSTQCSEKFVLIVWEYSVSACMYGINSDACDSLFDKSKPFAVRK